jgi:DNA-binding response OmpR family regulator
MTQLVVVEGDSGFAALLRSCLEVEGYEVALAVDAISGLACVNQWHADLVILDLNLPAATGFDLLEGLRAAANTVPVIGLTGRSADADQERAFALGADDCLTKPVPLRGLLACVKALLRRVHDGERAGPSWVHIGDIAIHPPTRRVRRRQTLVKLRPKEYELLTALLHRYGCAVSRADLLRDVWSQGSTPQTRTVDTTIVSLRKKLEQNPLRPRLIVTVHGAGYMLNRYWQTG